ncbi:MAG: hypothetical protein ACI4KF_09820 [Huintestinicola sp.]
MAKKKRELFIVRAFRGMLWWFIGEIVCSLFCMCMLLLMQRFLILKMFTGLASVLIVNGLYFNFTYNTAAKDRDLVRYHGVPEDKFMGVKMALMAPLPQYIMWIVLLLSKLGVIRDVFNIYILANMQSIAFVDMFTDSRTIDALSWGGIFGLLFLTLISSVVIAVTYNCVFKDIDVKGKLLYGKKNQ